MRKRSKHPPKKQKTNLLSYWFRAEVTKSSLHFLNVRKLGGSVSICHQNELSPADHSSLQRGRTGKTRQQAKLASIYDVFGCCFQVHSSWTSLHSPFAQHLLSPCSSPVSWPAPYLDRTLLCTAMQPDRTREQVFGKRPAQFPLKRKKNHLSGLVFAAIIDYNDLIGKRRVLFLWERSSGIYVTK